MKLTVGRTVHAYYVTHPPTSDGAREEGPMAAVVVEVKVASAVLRVLGATPLQDLPAIVSLNENAILGAGDGFLWRWPPRDQ